MTSEVIMKRSSKKALNEKQKNVLIARAQLQELREGINDAYCVFNSVSDPDALDSIIFEISALQSKYSLLLKRYKEISEV